MSGVVLGILIGIIGLVGCNGYQQDNSTVATGNKPITWKAPDTSTIPKGKTGELIRYGRELIVHTAQYLGPKGSVAQISNGMNCQNCHLDAGSKLLGNAYIAFIANYPKMSGRSGKVEPATQRITECFERSLAGAGPAASAKEMQAILA